MDLITIVEHSPVKTLDRHATMNSSREDFIKSLMIRIGEVDKNRTKVNTNDRITRFYGFSKVEGSG